MLGVWARVVLLLGLLTLLARDRTLLLWFLALAAAWAGGGLLLGRALDALAVSLALSPPEAVAGDTITVHMRIANRSALPLPWVRIDQTLPRRLEARRPSWIAALPPGQAFEAEYRLRLPRRGIYRIGRVGLQAGDWFGLWRREGWVEVPLWVAVLPRPLTLEVPPPPPRLPEGARPLSLSPFRAWEPAGLREYRRGDPPRWIAWKATARRGGELVVRELPPVRDRAHLVVLDLRPSAWPEVHRAAWLERAIALAATRVAQTGRGDEPVGLFTVGVLMRYEPEPVGRAGPGEGGAHHAAGVAGGDSLPGGAVTVRLPPRRGIVYRRELLRTLAALEPGESPAFSRLALAAVRALAARSSLLWITGGGDGSVRAAAAAAARADHAVSVAMPAAATGAAFAPGVSVWPIPPGEGEGWGP